MNPINPSTSNQPTVENPVSPPDENRPADRGSTWVSFFVSVIVHINVILILAMSFRAFQEEEHPVVLDTTFIPGEEQDSLRAEELANDVELLDAEAVFSDSAPMTADEMLRTETRPGLSGLFGGGGADGLGGLGAGGGVGFFGTTARGRSFVFVVDCSGSMQGQRFYRAVMELRESINQLDRDQQFQIVFFNNEAVPLDHSKFGRKLIPAEPEALQEVFDWIGDRRADGGTSPDAALRRALALKPDVVFFLTDADRVPRSVRTLIAEENTHGSIVHTIAFGHKGGETLMQGIAADHHGRYRFVP